MFESFDNPDDPHAPDKPAQEFEPQSARWYKARPERLPAPTYWPVLLALGLAFLFWGLLTIWIISAAGLLLVGFALAGWINILRHE